MAIEVGDRVEFKTPDMPHAETSTVEHILINQEGTQYYVYCASLNHYKAIRKDAITFRHSRCN